MRSFSKKNLQTIIANGRSITPDPKFTLLRLGLKNYYTTFQPFNKRFDTYYFEGENSEKLSSIIDHDYITASYSSIIFIHLFFEHYLSSILYAIKPNFLYGKLNKEKDFINAFITDSEDIVVSETTINYNIQLDRICKLIINDATILEEFRVPLCFHFILKHKQGLTELAHQRNEIIHLGDKILATYAYELLMANYVLPVINEVLIVEKNVPYIKRLTHCDVDVIDELTNIKLQENHLKNLKKTNTLLRKINHYKELGRASFKNPLRMFQDYHNAEFKKDIEESHNKPLREVAISQTKLKWDVLKTPRKIHICPCCGTNSLLTCGWFEDSNLTRRVLKAECLLCTYSINQSIGEPSECGIKCEELFEILK